MRQDTGGYHVPRTSHCKRLCRYSRVSQAIGVCLYSGNEPSGKMVSLDRSESINWRVPCLVSEPLSVMMS